MNTAVDTQLHRAYAQLTVCTALLPVKRAHSSAMNVSGSAASANTSDAQSVSSNGSTNTPGLFPGGEGAGYAGGILSAAIDGIKLAEAVANSISASTASV